IACCTAVSAAWSVVLTAAERKIGRTGEVAPLTIIAAKAGRKDCTADCERNAAPDRCKAGLQDDRYGNVQEQMDREGGLYRNAMRIIRTISFLQRRPSILSARCIQFPGDLLSLAVPLRLLRCWCRSPCGRLARPGARVRQITRSRIGSSLRQAAR